MVVLPNFYIHLLNYAYHSFLLNAIHIVQIVSIVSIILLCFDQTSTPTNSTQAFFSDTICKPGWFILPTFGCYQIYEDTATWQDAGEKCRQMNGNLVSWETRDEFFTMKTYLEANFCKSSS